MERSLTSAAKWGCGKTWLPQCSEDPAAGCARELFFRPAGAGFFLLFTHALRRGLHSFAASRLLPVAARL